MGPAWPGWWMRSLADLTDPFARALLALDLLAVDPGLGGLAVRARSGPVREALLRPLEQLPGPRHRLHPQVSDEALYGGLDLSATLASGHLVQEQGLLRDPSLMVLAMAERCPDQLAARLALCLDEGRGHVLIALDEGAEPDERCPDALAERLAFAVDLSETPLGHAAAPADRDLDAARARLSGVARADDLLPRIAALSLQLGIGSLRVPLFTLRAARAHAALAGHDEITGDDLSIACALTMAHRATQMPEAEPQDPAPAESEEPANAPDPGDDDGLVLPEELLLEAVAALLPPGLLAELQARKARLGKGSGSGAAHKGNRRGRPLPARPGRLGSGARIDLVATLRSAAPWQTIRAKTAPQRDGLHIRASDIRLKRYEERSDRLLIFTVDASGSAALARLAEAKGAIELLLGEAYARRDHVSLVAFRGTGAELLLPPTRSLVQTKRRLAELPGGGGTPLASGLQLALEQADLALRRGLTPTVCLLTDGRANIALDGTANRPQAGEDAERLARVLRFHGIEALVIDTGNRPEKALKRLAETLDAPYIPLPRADAERLSRSVTAALER